MKKLLLLFLLIPMISFGDEYTIECKIQKAKNTTAQIGSNIDFTFDENWRYIKLNSSEGLLHIPFLKDDSDDKFKRLSYRTVTSQASYSIMITRPHKIKDKFKIIANLLDTGDDISNVKTIHAICENL